MDRYLASAKRSLVAAKVVMGVSFILGLAALCAIWPLVLENLRAHAAAIAGGLGVLFLGLALVDWMGPVSERRLARWRMRRDLQRPIDRGARAARALQRFLRPLALEPILTRSTLVASMLGYWRDAGLGNRASLMFACWAMSSGLVGLLIAWLSGSGLLGGMGLVLATIGMATIVTLRALALRRRFAEQLPDLLDRLADCLEAGFSLPQAFEFVRPNMPEPSSSETGLVVRQVNLGYSVDEALDHLGRRRPGPELELLIEGLVLQRQLGGNMTDLMRGVAGFVRTRQALEAEVRTLTAQGRLSAVVIALLVPASLILLSFFPGYVTVLLRTTIGNLILVTAAVLELLGAAIVARVVRVEY